MNTSQLWNDYTRAFECLVEARMRVHPHRQELSGEIARSLVQPGLQCPAALAFLNDSALDTAVTLLPIIVSVALSVHGSTAKSMELLAELPRDSVIAVVAEAEQKAWARRDYEVFACLLELWSKLGCDERALSLAKLAASDTDDNIRDVGQSFIQRFEPQENELACSSILKLT